MVNEKPASESLEKRHHMACDQDDRRGDCRDQGAGYYRLGTPKVLKAELNSVYPLVIWLQYRYLMRVLPLYLYTLAAHVFPIRIANPRRAVRHALRFNITICRVSPQVTVSSLKATQQTLTYENAMPINLTDIPGPDS